jgi:hypothetical protein
MTSAINLRAWQAEGARRFNTTDARAWRFRCPACGQVQTANELIALGVPHYERYFAFSCIGRFHLNNPAAADSVVTSGPGAGFGCMYSGSEGLAPVLLEITPGEIRPTFEFA